MIIAAFFSSVEFYVIAAIFAAAVIAYASRPATLGAVKHFLIGGNLCKLTDNVDDKPRVAVRCTDTGDVLLTRLGIADLTTDGAVSLVIDVKGFEVVVEERIAYSPGGESVDTALFTLDFMGHERYSVRYENKDLGLMAVFTLNNRPGMEFVAPLRR
ncbi:MAG: hypothetical protein K2M94_08220 [Paramuribaculum sp.]|nr:hypothetical protein [Paramuribaculum sp.]